MFTKNFDLWQRAIFAGASLSGFKDESGSSKTIYPGGNYYSQYSKGPGARMHAAYCKTNVNTSGVYFGSDPTPATKDDYTLGARITSGLSITNPQNQTRSEKADTGSVTYSAAFTVTNTTSNEIAISEIGLFADSSDGNNSNQFYLLMDRTVLTEPIVIAPGAVKVITYELVFHKVLEVS